MALSLTEWFGYDLQDWSQQAIDGRARAHCPFLDAPCTKHFNDGSKSGACSGRQTQGTAVIMCPNRLYANDYRILRDISEVAFGSGITLLHPSRILSVHHDGTFVVPFGKRFGRELQLPRSVGNAGGYFVDWILARIGPDAELAEFVAVEVQTIDTTGSYRSQVTTLRQGYRSPEPTVAGFNWENVAKRILPQLIYKGHVLRREALCTKGLFFVCPSQVYQKIEDRLGNGLLPYTNLQPGSISFRRYELGPFTAGPRPLAFAGQFSTTVDQVAIAFTAASNLPAAGVYETAIRQALHQAKNPKSL